jgi:hypothetical protein
MIKLQIETTPDNPLVASLASEAGYDDRSFDIREIGTHRVNNMAGGGGSYVVEFLVTLSTNVGMSLFASWLYDRLKSAKKVTRVRIDGLEVELEVGALLAAVANSNAPRSGSADADK